MFLRKVSLKNVAIFIKDASEKGLLMIIAFLFAMLFANTDTATYHRLIQTPIISSLDHSNIFYIVNDFLMAIFFLLVGLEIKREVLEGHLSSFSRFATPMFAAIGGVIFPAIIYYVLNKNNSEYLSGWAIPVATDIAFALAALSVVGKSIPISLKVFLTALAIIDDIFAVVIIAFFYSDTINAMYLFVSGFLILMLCLLNYANIKKLTPYFTLGAMLLLSIYFSGVHSTIAGVILGLIIPLNIKSTKYSPLKYCEDKLSGFVLFFVLPLFAFVNSGINFGGLLWDDFFASVTVGIIFGLFLGKQFGVFLFCVLGVKIFNLQLPKGASWFQLYGVAVLCGIGFTMSLFIGNLSFESEHLINQTKLGVVFASLMSCIFGAIVFYFAKKRVK